MLTILYRDALLIAIDKPAGLLTHRSDIDRHETRFAVQMLRDQIGQRVQPVHRLDRGTSGVLLFALDAQANRALGVLKPHADVRHGQHSPQGLVPAIDLRFGSAGRCVYGVA